MVLVRPQYTRRCSEDGQTTQGQVMACRAQCAGVGAAMTAAIVLVRAERGEKIPHVWHIVLTVLTLGLWSAIYGLHLLIGGLKRLRIELHRGEVRERRLM